MTWHAIDDIGDAIEATRALVTPFEWWVWLRLGVVVALVGGAGGGIGQLSNVFQFGTGPDIEGLLAPVAAAPTLPSAAAQFDPASFDPDLAGPAMILVVALALVAVLALLLLTSVGTTMEFVLVETLARERVSVGADFGANYGNGLRLAVFRFALWALALLVVGGLVLALLGPDPSAWTGAAVLNALAPLLVVGLVVFVFVTVGNGFTTVFVVPIMLVEGCGVLGGWRRLLASISRNLGQYALYLVVSVLLGVGVSIVLGFAMLFALLAVVIPTGLLALGLFVALSGPALWILGGVVVFVGVVALAVAALFVSMPLVVFLRYYALFVLGDVEPSLDPIPAVRSSIREDGEPSTAP